MRHLRPERRVLEASARKMSAGQRGPYAGARFSILTQHGKEREMAPLFADGLDVRLELAMGFDTDSFGSFTREVARQGNQLEAARAKATKGMELLALDFGIASEGSFHPGSFGLYPSNLEPRARRAGRPAPRVGDRRPRSTPRSERPAPSRGRPWFAWKATCGPT